MLFLSKQEQFYKNPKGWIAGDGFSDAPGIEGGNVTVPHPGNPARDAPPPYLMKSHIQKRVLRLFRPSENRNSLFPMVGKRTVLDIRCWMFSPLLPYPASLLAILPSPLSAAKPLPPLPRPMRRLALLSPFAPFDVQRSTFDVGRSTFSSFSLLQRACSRFSRILYPRRSRFPLCTGQCGDWRSCRPPSPRSTFDVGRSPFFSLLQRACSRFSLLHYPRRSRNPANPASPTSSSVPGSGITAIT